ncbi:MAG: acyl-CoA dehydrogenase family protein, partial [Myxococcota bacterium]
MDFDFTPEEQAFRVTVQGFLAENLPDPANEYDPDFLAEWDRKIAAQGWLGFAWPRDAGGAGASLIEQFILKEEMSAAWAPRLGRDFMGLTWVGPAIISHGTEAQ